MNNVFVDVGISLDGFIAGPNGGTKNPLGDGGINIHNWMFNQKKSDSILEKEITFTRNNTFVLQCDKSKQKIISFKIITQ